MQLTFECSAEKINVFVVSSLITTSFLSNDIIIDIIIDIIQLNRKFYTDGITNRLWLFYNFRDIDYYLIFYINNLLISKC